MDSWARSGSVMLDPTVTSATPQEGKTTVAANLATVLFAQTPQVITEVRVEQEGRALDDRVINKDTSTLRLNSVTGFQAGLSVTSRGRALVDDPKIQRDEATLRTSIGAPDANDAQLHEDIHAVVHTVWALRDGFRPDQVTVGVREWTWAEGVTQPDHWEPGQVAAEVTLKVPG